MRAAILAALSIIGLSLTGLADEGAQLAGGRALLLPDGELRIMNGGALAASLKLKAPGKGWRFFKCQAAKSIGGAPDGAQTATGSLNGEKAGEIAFSAAARENGSKIELLYELEALERAELEAPPFLAIEVPAALFDGKAAKLGDRIAKLPADGQWWNGKEIALPEAEAAIDLAESASISSWDLRKWKIESFELRIQFKTKSPKLMEKGERATLAASISMERRKIAEPISQSAWKERKSAAYRRVLACPQENGVPSAAAWELLERGEIAKLESWLGARSALSGASDRLRHLEAFASFHETPPLAPFRDLREKALAALGGGRPEEAAAAAAELRDSLAKAEAALKAKHGFSYYPGTEFNPCGWIKNFATLNFKRHPESSFVLEPSPFSAAWNDGAAISLVDRDEAGFAIEKAMTTEKTEYDGVQFKRTASLSFERSWVGTEWSGQGGERFTFSVLSPLILAEGCKTLNLYGIKELYEAVYPGEGGALQSAKPESDGSIQLPPGMPKENWLVLSGKSCKLLVALERKPSTMRCSGKGVAIEFAKRSFAALGSLPEWDGGGEAALKARTMARMALALPFKAVEERSGNSVRFKYLYKTGRDEWGSSPLKSAPVPPLATLAGIKIPGAKSLKGASRYGDFQYLEADELSFEVPARTRKPLRGVNMQPKDVARDAGKMKADGFDWVRLFIGRDYKSQEEGFALTEEALGVLERQGLKVLLDPHDFIFKIDRKSGQAPKDEASRAEFIELWKRLSSTAMGRKGCIAGYDFYNELPIRAKGWEGWLGLANEAASAVRAGGDDTPIYLTCPDYANPGGFLGATPAPFGNAVYSFHFYVPHSFTHQKVEEKSGSAPNVFYPGWAPPVDWGSSTYGKGPLEWWDRWELGAALLAPLEFMHRNKAALHCGELGVVGYAKGSSGAGAGLWTQDSIDWMERNGIDWQLWNLGFGLCVPEAAEAVRAKLGERL